VYYHYLYVLYDNPLIPINEGGKKIIEHTDEYLCNLLIIRFKSSFSNENKVKKLRYSGYISNKNMIKEGLI